jgi:uncharacterized membrane protein HdeD (DUF308 family)
MTSSPPPSDGTPEPNGAEPAEPENAPETPAAEPVDEPEPEPEPVSAPEPEPEPVDEPEPTAEAPDPEPATAAPEPELSAEEWPSEPTADEWPSEPSAGGRRADIDGVSAVAEDLIARGAPWDARTSWTIVLVEGIVAAVIGLLFIFKPLGGSSTTLQIVGLVLLAGSLITAFQLWRHHLRPEIEQLASFRSGSGVTVGLVVIVATLFVPVTDSVVAALAVVVGVGFFIFGISGIGMSFVRMQLDAPLPLFTLVANAVLALAGLLLVLAGARGADSVDGIFNWLGVLLIAAGLALAGYAYMLRQQDESR